MPVAPLCPAPKLNAPEVELAPGVATLSPKPPPPAGAAGPPNVKGDGVVLPNTVLLVPLLVVGVAAPKENTAVVLPKAGWVLAGAPKAAAVAFRPPKEDCVALPNAGWPVASTGAALGAGAAEFPKLKELPKLGARAGLAAPGCCPSTAPNVGWGLAPGYAGAAGLVLEPKGMLNAGVVVLLNVSVGWLGAAGAEVLREPKPPKPAVLLAAVWAALGRDWPKVAAAAEVGTAGLPNWNMEPTAGVKLAAEAGGAPKRNGCAAVEAVVLVPPPTPKPNAGFAESADEVVVTQAAAELAAARPVKRGAVAAVVAAAVVVCLKEKGVAEGTGAGSPELPKMGLKVRVEALVVVGAGALAAAAVVTGGPGGEGPSLSLLGVATNMGLNMGEAVVVAGAVGAVGVAGVAGAGG